MDYAKAIQLLQDQIDEGNALLQARPLSQNEHDSWEIVTESHLRIIFGKDSLQDEAVFQRRTARAFPMNADEVWRENYRSNELKGQIARLGAIIKSHSVQQTLDIDNTPPGVSGHKVFLVHGHNEAIKFNVARFLEKLEQDVILLDEQPNRGQTIIEKFEQHSDVGFAIVLLTGDDRGANYDSPADALRPRARQNVIFELGYFIGKLGRNRVCALYEESVELPSDYFGVLYIPIDKAGGWKHKLVRELSEAGFAVDLNKVR